MIIEVAHPNDLKRWKTVDTISSLGDLPEMLATPSFEWHPGLVVRVHDNYMTQYTGIFNETHCVCVDYGSQIMDALFTYYGSYTSFIHTRSLISIWSECTKPSWMIKMFEGYIDSKPLARVVVRLAREVAGDPTLIHALNEADAHIDGDRSFDEIYSLRDSVLDDATSKSDYAVAHAIGACLSLESTITSYAMEAVSSAEIAAGQENQLADIFRDQISFLDIVLKVTK